MDVLYVFSKSEDTGKIVCKEGGFDALTQYLVDMKPSSFALETDAIELTCAAVWNLLQVGLPARTGDAARQKDQWQNAVARVNDSRVQRIAKTVGCRLLLAVVKALSVRDSLVTNLCRVIAVTLRFEKNIGLVARVDGGISLMFTILRRASAHVLQEREVVAREKAAMSMSSEEENKVR